MIEVLEDQEIEKINNDKKCKNNNSHHFGGDLKVLSFCECYEWQIIERITDILIKCINIEGQESYFERF